MLERVRSGVQKDEDGQYHAADLLHAQKLLQLKKQHSKNLKELVEGEPKEEVLFKYFEATKGQIKAVTELSERVIRSQRDQEFAANMFMKPH